MLYFKDNIFSLSKVNYIIDRYLYSVSLFPLRARKLQEDRQFLFVLESLLSTYRTKPTDILLIQTNLSAKTHSTRK